MERSGDARERLWSAKSTVSVMCTAAATVQESMWKSPHRLPPMVSKLPFPRLHACPGRTISIHLLHCLRLTSFLWIGGSICFFYLKASSRFTF
ncbi:growth-regulating factor [Musa troglodytarum]|uniref:Growth-regulating factor n=1 Tax=Musa troglodytarum TaxID=320322 RepID=A0A9E7HY57_9LILI|nr:growth-regulating factor [Musa troglodytarum]